VEVIRPTTPVTAGAAQQAVPYDDGSVRPVPSHRQVRSTCPISMRRPASHPDARRRR